MTHRFRPTTLVVSLVTALLLLVGAAAPPASADSGSSSNPQLQALLDALVARGAPGALALVDNGQTTSRVASGAARLDPRQRMRPNARFRIGSVTKTFVATVALQLVNDGKLRLDDTVERWLPGLVPNGKAIILRMLLNHTSGLYEYTRDPTFVRRVIRKPTASMTPRQLVAIATAHAPTFAPGARWSYSNTGYIVAGLMIEAAAGQRIERLLRQRIVRPLGLGHTMLPTRPRIDGYHAHGYVAESPTSRRFVDVTRWSPSLVWAAGAMVSTADDLRRFYSALLGGRLLPASLLAQMQTTVAAAPGMQYGLGLIAQRTPCGVGWGHTGSVPGYATFAFTNRSGHRAVVLMVSTQRTATLAPVLVAALAVAACQASGRLPTASFAPVPQAPSGLAAAVGSG
jgi:D-alanyl-D-alanine carboxypeptidase